MINKKKKNKRVIFVSVAAFGILCVFQAPGEFPAAKREEMPKKCKKIHKRETREGKRERGECKEEHVDNRVELTGIYGRRLKIATNFQIFDIFQIISSKEKKTV